jgi:FkbM family methyltransferase
MSNQNELMKLLDSLDNKISEHSLKGRDIVIFGAGNTSLLYGKCFEKEKISISCFCDNDTAKHGKMFLGAPVISPERLHELRDPYVLICSAQVGANEAIALQLSRLNIEHIRIDEYVFAKRRKEIGECVSLLDGKRSREVYCEAIAARLQNRSIDPGIFERFQYFAIPEFSMTDGNEIFVDMGAFTGDTLESYIFTKSGTFKKIYAFEPDMRNFTAMVHRIERLKKEWALDDNKIRTVLAGVGAVTEKLYLSGEYFKSSNLGCSFNSPGIGEERQIWSLDDYFKCEKATFIKADIESFEQDMLMGAKETIRKNRPLIAVSIYHNASDMYSIIKYLNELDMDYHFAVRHHSPLFSDTVLYAY